MLIFSPNCFAQTDALSSIRNYYSNINAQIKTCATDFECGLYANEVLVNTRNNSWSAVGQYKKKIIFWYNDYPQHCDECGENGINVLQKIEIQEQSSVNDVYEIMFKNGERIFYYRKKTGLDNSEHCYYFINNELISYMEKPEDLYS